MAKLSQLKKVHIIPTSIEGVFLKDLPFKRTQEVLAKAGAAGSNDLSGVLYLFSELICDSTGKAFEDAKTVEDLQENMPSRLLNDIMKAIPEALNPGEDRLGK